MTWSAVAPSTEPPVARARATHLAEISLCVLVFHGEEREREREREKGEEEGEWREAGGTHILLILVGHVLRPFGQI